VWKKLKERLEKILLYIPLKALSHLYSPARFLKCLTDKRFRGSIKVKRTNAAPLNLFKPLSIADFSVSTFFSFDENYFVGNKNRLNLFHSNFLNNQL